MPIDARLALTGNPLQIDNPLDVYAKGMNIAGLQKQNRLADLAFGQKKSEIASANALSGAYAAAVKPDGTVDREKLRAGLAAAGQGSAIPGVNAQFAGEDRATLEAQDAQLKAALGKMSYVSQRLSGATPENWAATVQDIAATAGPQAAANLPKTFDPAAVQALIQSGVPIAEQLKQKAAEAAAKLAQANQEANREVVIRGQDLAHSDRQAAIAAKPGGGTSDKPMPPAALKLQTEALEAIGTASGTQANIAAFESQLAAGKLDFGPVSNLVNAGRNAAGLSTEESRNFASFKSSLEKMRNDSLRLNSGVQTDGDAQRAWNELFASITDKGVVAQRLSEIKRLNEQAVKLQKAKVNSVRANYGNGPIDTSSFEDVSPSFGSDDDIFSQADAILGGM